MKRIRKLQSLHQLSIYFNIINHWKSRADVPAFSISKGHISIYITYIYFFCLHNILFEQEKSCRQEFVYICSLPFAIEKDGYAIMGMIWTLYVCETLSVCLSFCLFSPIYFFLLRSYHRNSTIDDFILLPVEGCDSCCILVFQLQHCNP